MDMSAHYLAWNTDEQGPVWVSRGLGVNPTR